MKTTPICAALVTLAGIAAAPVAAQSNLQMLGTSPVVSSQGASGDYMTTAEGCTYRRTQAPGYAPKWILVLNPHHIGRPNSPLDCNGMRG